MKKKKKEFTADSRRCLLFAAALFIFCCTLKFALPAYQVSTGANICPARARDNPLNYVLWSGHRFVCVEGHAKERGESTEIKSSSRDLPWAYEIARNNIGPVIFDSPALRCVSRGNIDLPLRGNTPPPANFHLFPSPPFERFTRVLFNVSRLSRHFCRASRNPAHFSRLQIRHDSHWTETVEKVKNNKITVNTTDSRVFKFLSLSFV